MKKIKIVCFTDPICTWCWGSEPVLRKLETHFPDRIEFEYVMGGMVRDVRDIVGSDDKIADFNKDVAAQWLEASKVHGMPVDVKDFHLFSAEYPSTYPENIAYEAAFMVDPKKADSFLYNLRLAAAAKGKVVAKEEELVELASKAGIEIDPFLGFINDGTAMKAFEEDQEYMVKVGADQFPTFIVEYGEMRYMLSGYNDYDNFLSVIEALDNEKIEPIEVEATEENLLAFMKKHPIMAYEEIKEAFDIPNMADTEAFVDVIVALGKLEKHKKGNGWFAKLK